MSFRLNDTILSAGRAYAADTPQNIVSLAVNGMFGHAPDLKHWLSATPHVDQHLRAILLIPPKIFGYLQDPLPWYVGLKNLIETLPSSIEGFDMTLRPEFDESAAGGAGEMMQVLIDMKRGRSEPVFNYERDKAGRPIQRYIGSFMQMFMMDPETKHASVLSLLPGFDPGDWLPDWYTFTCLFYNTDPINNRVDKAIITTNMQFMGQGDVTAKFDPNSAKETVSLSIPMTGLSVSNAGVVQYAQNYHRRMMASSVQTNPNLRPAFVGDIDPTIAALDTTAGYLNSRNVGSITTPIV